MSHNVKFNIKKLEISDSGLTVWGASNSHSHVRLAEFTNSPFNGINGAANAKLFEQAHSLYACLENALFNEIAARHGVYTANAVLHDKASLPKDIETRWVIMGIKALSDARGDK